MSLVHLCMCCLIFFFFKQKTAYEMRISDWSSDVCSSDLTINDSYMDPVGAIQNAWNNPGANKAPNQETPGYNRIEYRPDRVIPLRLREAMNTTIHFPADEIIEDVYVSDPVSFEAIVPRSNVVMVRVIRSEEHTSELRH